MLSRAGMSRRLIIIAILLIVGGVGFLLTMQFRDALVRDRERLVPLPELTLKDYGGREVRLMDFKGKPLVLNAWAAWCPFCKEELPDFAAAQKEFGDKILVVAIDRAEPLEVAKKYSDELGVGDSLLLLLDPEDSFYQAIGGFSMPETIFVDKDGFIRDHKRGPMKREEIRRRIQQAFEL